MRIAKKLLVEGKRQLSRLPQSVGIPLRRTDKARNKKLSPREARSLKEKVANCIARKGGQATSSLLAARLALQYAALDTEGRQDFLKLLAKDFDIDPSKVEKAVHAVTSTGSDELRSAAAILRRTLVPPRIELFRQWTLMPDGVKFLVDFRTDVLNAIANGIALKSLNADLKEFLESVFSAGILQLRTISWDSPASLLEKLIRYEAVHAIQGWDDLRNRLDSDRRCFAFFHPNLPDEPLIFVEVALCKGIADNVLRLLDTTASALEPQDADTAVFYSISNTQKGLAGIPFGDFLIKQVVSRLQHDVPGVERFVTLSPLPGFRRWLESEGGRTFIANLPATVLRNAACDSAELFWHKLQEITPDGAASIPEPFRKLMQSLATHYLTAVQHPGRNTAFDPVAHFHLSNGSRIEQINWGANLTERGIRESFGLMVNYRYKLKDIQRQHKDYVRDGIVHVSRQVRSLRIKHG